MWEVVEVTFGHSTGWDLRLRLEREGQIAQIVFPRPTSFRVHDERQLVSYWTTRADQGVQIGTLYLLKGSDVVQDFIQVEGNLPLQHFLVAGIDTCVEVIGTYSPQITLQKPPQAAT